MMPVFVLHSDGSERVPYTIPEIFFFSSRHKMDYIPSEPPIGHWHDEVEFHLVLEGQMTYRVNDTIRVVRSGEGLFINARQIHMYEETHSSLVCVLLHPMMLCANAYMEQRFISPVLSNPSLPFRHLKPDNPADRTIMDCVLKLSEAAELPEESRILRIQSLSYTLWEALLSVNPATVAAPHVNTQLTAMKSMMRCIQERYAEKLSLADIAESGHVCKSICGRLFHAYLHQTPIQFLVSYRLKKSAELLCAGEDNVTMIAETVGFSSASYFSEAFRAHFSCSPSEYRRLHREEI